MLPVIRNSQMAVSEINTVQVDGIDPTTDWSDKVVDCDVAVHATARVHVTNQMTEDAL